MSGFSCVDIKFVDDEIPARRQVEGSKLMAYQQNKHMNRTHSKEQPASCEGIRVANATTLGGTHTYPPQTRHDRSKGRRISHPGGGEGDIRQAPKLSSRNG